MCVKLMKEFAKKWYALLTHPDTFFKKEKTQPLSYGGQSIIFSAVISAIITLLLGIAYPQVLPELAMLLGTNVTIATAVLLLVGMPLIALVSWIILSGIFYVFARLLSGKGSFTSQAHSIALINSVFNIINTLVFGVLAIAATGVISVQIAVNAIITIYNFYVITIALRYAHKYSTLRAILTWLIPALIVLAIIAAAGFMILSLLNPA